MLGSIDGVGVRLTNVEHAIGGDGNDQLVGNTGANQLYGMRGNDNILGAQGIDTCRGGFGNDSLSGNLHADIMIGGPGADTFRFNTLRDSNPAGTDKLQAGDGGLAFDTPGAGGTEKIDLSGIDANVTAAGNQAFIFGSTSAKGHLRCINSGSDTRVVGNVDNDAAFEFQLDIVDGGTLASIYKAADFIL